MREGGREGERERGREGDGTDGGSLCACSDDSQKLETVNHTSVGLAPP